MSAEGLASSVCGERCVHDSGSDSDPEVYDRSKAVSTGKRLTVYLRSVSFLPNVMFSQPFSIFL